MGGEDVEGRARVGRRPFLVGAAALAGGVAWSPARARWALASAPASAASVGPLDAVEPVEPVPGLTIHPRIAWAGELAPVGALDTDEFRFLLVHHTAGANDYGPEDVAALLRGIYRFHTGSAKGWPDVCYHFFVDRHGGVWEGRAGSLERAVAADATGGNQGFAQLVCLVGNFVDTAPPAPMVDALVRLLAWSADRWNIDTASGAAVSFTSRGSNRWPAGVSVTTPTIAGHRDMSATACPGDVAYALVRGELAGLVHAARTAVVLGPEVTRRPGPPVRWWDRFFPDLARRWRR